MIASSTGEDNLYMKTGKIIYKLVQKVFFFCNHKLQKAVQDIIIFL